MIVCQFPERVIVASVGVISLPAFSNYARQGRDLKDSYLSAIEHITAVQWPSLIFLVLLAHPIVSMLLGRQWLGAVPLVQTVAGALLFYFPIGLTYPIIVAARGVRHMPWLVLVQGIVSISVLSIAVRYGLQAVASSTFLTVPFNVFLSVLLVRFHVPFRWGELAAAMRKSFTVSVLFATGPFVIVIGCGWRVDLSMSSAIFGGHPVRNRLDRGTVAYAASPFERVALRSKCRAWQPDHCESARCGQAAIRAQSSFVRKNMIVKVRLSIARPLEPALPLVKVAPLISCLRQTHRLAPNSCSCQDRRRFSVNFACVVVRPLRGTGLFQIWRKFRSSGHKQYSHQINPSNSLAIYLIPRRCREISLCLPIP